MPCNCRQGVGLHDHLGDTFMRDGGALGVGASLNRCVDLPALQVWNSQQTAVEAQRLFNVETTDNNEPVCSDADPELLLFVPLKSVCRVKGMCIMGPVNDFAPLSVKVFCNPVEVTGFDSVRRLVPQEEIALAQVSAHDRIVYRLSATKFATVSTLALLFEHSFNDDETHLLRIELFGEDSGRLTSQQVATNMVYEGLPNPADHRTAEEKRQLFEVQ